jgi:hypothetical protein
VPSIGPVPWAWTRRQIARAWNVAPWLVDWALEECPGEVELELQLMSIEHDERPKD